MNSGGELPAVSEEELALTPTSVKRLLLAMGARITALEARVAALESENAALRADNAALRADNARLVAENISLRAENASLRERLNLNSNNSSKPPSSDGPAVPPRPPANKSKKKRGAQKGHARNSRPLLSPDQVDTVRELRPSHCAACERPLRGDDPDPQRRQAVELASVLTHVTEWRLHTLTCEHCAEKTSAEWTEEAPPGAFGPKLLALVALMTGRYRVSKRSVEEMLSEVFGIDMSLGSVCEAERRVSTALAAPVQAATEYVRAQPVAHMDETSWCENKTRAWLWVFAARLVTVFRIDAHRSEEAAQTLLGSFSGVLVTDRYSAYGNLVLGRRQVCWSHLIRDFTRISEREGESGWIGQELLSVSHKVFLWWSRFKSGEKDRAWLLKKISPLRARVGSLLASGQACGHPQTEGTCAEMEKVQSSFWTFVKVEGVEPTNNFAERQIRHGVMWRKTSFGTDSEAGSRFVERILSVVKSLKSQGRNILAFIQTALVALWRKIEIPSLLPQLQQLQPTTP